MTVLFIWIINVIFGCIAGAALNILVEINGHSRL